MRKGLNLPKEATFKGPALIWKRVLAFVIDILIINFVIGFPFRRLIAGIVPARDFSNSYAYISSNQKLVGLLSLIMILFGLLAILYFAILEYKMGQTVGKMFMNIKVEAEQLTFFSCLIRSMFLIFIFPFVLLWVIDPLFMFFTKDKRRLSEILSKTRTIEIYLL